MFQDPERELPPWQSGNQSHDGDPVNLSTGAEEYTAGSDLVAFNDRGPDAVFQRYYYSRRPLDSEESRTGLGYRWVSNLDVRLRYANWQGSDGLYEWRSQRHVLQYPNGAQEDLGSWPLTARPGSPLSVTGGSDADALPEDRANVIVKFPDLTTWEFEFDTHCNDYALKRIADRTGRGIVVHRGHSSYSMEPILAVRDDSGRNLLTFSYFADEGGHLLLNSVTDAVSGRTVTYVPTADGPTAVSRINAPGLPRWTYAYEGGLLSRIAQPSADGTGEVWTDIDYDSGRVAQTSDSAGHVRRYTYDYGYPVAETGCTIPGTLVELLDSPNGAVLHSYVEKVDAATGFTRGRYENGRESTVEYCADQEGYIGPNRTKPWRVTDFTGRVTEYAWDDRGGLAAVTLPSTVGTTTTTVLRTWGPEGYPHPAGCQIQTGTQTPTILTYESARGLLTTIQSPVPGAGTGSQQWVSTSLTYDSTTGDLLTFTRPAPATSGTVTATLEYTDATHPSPMKGRPLKVRVPSQGSSAYVTRFAWNTDGTLQSVIDPANHTTEYTYGLTHQPASVRFPATGENGTGRAQLRYGYGFSGGPLTSLRLYDESATFDANGNPLSSPLAQTLYGYDENGRIVSRQGDTEPAFARYDALGRLAWLADGNGFNPSDPENSVRTAYAYESTDALAQVEVTFPGGESPYARHVPENDPCDFAVEYSPLLSLFTGTGMLNLGFAGPDAELTDKEVTGQSSLNVHLVYDPYRRVTETWHGAGDTNYDAYTTFVDKEVRAYDDLDNVTSIQFTYAGLPSRTISYTYFPDGHRKTMAVSGLGTFAYTYNLAGQLKSITNPYSQVFTYGYNSEGLLTSQSSAFLSTSYTYNAREQLKTIHNQNASSSQPTIFSDFAVTHDGVGNIKTLGASHFGWVIPPPGAMVPMALLPSYYEGATTYTYSPSVGEQSTGYGPLRREHTTRFNSPADTVYAYDAASNPVTFRGTGPLAYNANNQSTGITYDDAGNPATRGAASLTFNIDNQLTTYNGTAVTCGYRADGLRAWKQVGATRTYYLYDGTAPLCEMNSGGSITAVTTFGANGLLARRVGAADTHYAFDPSGNVANYVTSPVTASHTGFDAFGKRYGAAYTDPFGFQAQWGAYTDRSSAADTGLVLMGYRYYDPTTGRFLNRDPIGYAGGINLYAYCRNNPVNIVDPAGLCGSSSENDDFETVGFAEDRYDLFLTRAPDLIHWGQTIVLLTGNMPSTGGTFPRRTEVKGPPVSSNGATDEWDRFLGPGQRTNIHPRTGDIDSQRIVTQTGDNEWRSIRMGKHETVNPANQHYHEETWTVDPSSGEWNVLNRSRGIIR